MKLFDIVMYPLKKLMEKSIQEEVNKRITETVNRDKEDENWRRISDMGRTTDLPSVKQDKMIKVMDWLVDRKPQAKRMIELIVDFVAGDGLKIIADSGKNQEETQKVLDRFWKINQWELKQFDKIGELGKYGELIFVPFVNEFDGTIKMGSIDPERIKTIKRNPENAEELVEIVMKQSKGTTKTYEIMKENFKTEKKEDEGRIEGEAFYFPVNKGSFGTRGKSDLLAVADWIDIYDRTLYTMTERVPFLLAFVWEIIMKGASEPEMRKKLNDLKLHPPKPGSFWIHNDNEEIKASSPDLKAADFSKFFQLLKTQLTSGSGLSGHWLFGFGDNINKAVSQEISEPTYRQLKRRQKVIISIWTFMCQYQIQEAIAKGDLKEKVEDYPFKIVAPDPSRKDAKLVADTIAAVMPGTAIAMMNKLITADTGREIFALLASQLGIDIDIEKEKEKIETPEEGVENAVKQVVDAIKKKEEPVEEPEEPVETKDKKK